VYAEVVHERAPVGGVRDFAVLSTIASDAPRAEGEDSPIGGVARYTPNRVSAPSRRSASGGRVDPRVQFRDSKGKLVKSVLSAKPVLFFLFLFNAAVAVAVAAAGSHVHVHGHTLNGTQQLMTAVGMGVVALGAGAALARRRPVRP
jgi:hypothetical protein